MRRATDQTIHDHAADDRPAKHEHPDRRELQRHEPVGVTEDRAAWHRDHDEGIARPAGVAQQRMREEKARDVVESDALTPALVETETQELVEELARPARGVGIMREHDARAIDDHQRGARRQSRFDDGAHELAQIQRGHEHGAHGAGVVDDRRADGDGRAACRAVQGIRADRRAARSNGQHDVVGARRAGQHARPARGAHDGAVGPREGEIEIAAVRADDAVEQRRALAGPRAHHLGALREPEEQLLGGLDEARLIARDGLRDDVRAALGLLRRVAPRLAVQQDDPRDESGEAERAGDEDGRHVIVLDSRNALRTPGIIGTFQI
jgi:hypothetical protein